MTGRDNADRFFMTYHVHDKKESLALRPPDRGIASFLRLARVHDPHERIEEDLAGYLERDAMLHEICGCLGRVPFECHTAMEISNGSAHSVLTKAIRRKARPNADRECQYWRLTAGPTVWLSG